MTATAPSSELIRHLIAICHMIYARRLSDSAGGNVSVRTDGLIYCSPRYMGSKYRWSIQPEQVSVLNHNLEIMQGPDVLSRESKAHFAIYDAFPNVGSVIHAHPHDIMVFAAARRTIPPLLEYTRKFGPIRPIEPTPAHSSALAERVVERLNQQGNDFAKHGGAVLLPYHGIIVAGRDLDDAYDTLERIERAAHCTLLGRLLTE